VERGEKRKERQQAGISPATAAFIAAGVPKGRRATEKTQGRTEDTTPVPPQPKKSPRTAAVQIICLDGERAEVMRLARARVNLEELGIREMRPRRARTGALLLEIPGVEGAQKADALADKLRVALADKEGMLITRPQKTAEIRIRDLEDSISEEEVAVVLAEKGGCHPDEIRVGPIRQASNGLGSAWVKCPLTAASKIVKEGTFRLGWTRAKTEVLPERTLRCYRCWDRGHVQAVCTSKKDRSRNCYRCGQEGHPARGCTAPAKCAICAESKRPVNHRAGGPACRAPIPRKKKAKIKGRNETPTPTPTAAASPGGGTPMEGVEEESKQSLPERPAKGVKGGEAND